MHDRLSQILDQEVVGEVTQVGAAFYDVGLGRVCLDQLSRSRIDEMVYRLKQAFGEGIQIQDRLNLDQPREALRGLVEVHLRPSDEGTSYILQISTADIFALYERRFFLEPGVLGDVMGTLCRGLARIVSGAAEGPLRLLSGFDRLMQTYQRQLDEVMRVSAAGRRLGTTSAVEELIGPLRRAWALIPWPLREPLSPVARMDRDSIARHDQVLRRTLLFAHDVFEGRIVYQYSHQHNPLEEYCQVLGWMTDIHRAMISTYPAPRFAAAMVRASSLQRFMDHFPAYQRVVGSPLADENGVRSDDLAHRE